MAKALTLRLRGHRRAEPVQARSIAKRRALITAARKLFAQHGYGGTSIEMITARADTATGAFYIYFQGKQDILVELMNELLEKLAATDLQPSAAANMRSALRRFLADVFRLDRQYYGVIAAWREAVVKDRALKKLDDAIAEWTGARVLGVFQELQRYPGARGRVDVTAFARMMDQHFWRLLARTGSMSAQEFDDEVRLAADVIYFCLFRG